jgi:hypothetical protein
MKVYKEIEKHFKASFLLLFRKLVRAHNFNLPQTTSIANLKEMYG